MAEIVRERDGLGEVLVEAQLPRDRARDLRHLERVRQPRAIVVALVEDEHLRLVGETPEGGGMQDAVAVALEGAARRASASAPAAATRHRACRGVGRARPRRAKRLAIVGRPVLIDCCSHGRPSRSCRAGAGFDLAPIALIFLRSDSGTLQAPRTLRDPETVQ